MGALKAVPRKKRMIVSRTDHFFVLNKPYAVIRLKNARTAACGPVKLESTRMDVIATPAIA